MLPSSLSVPHFEKSTWLRPNLRASIYDAGCFGFMVGIGEMYLSNFALDVGLGEVVTGLATGVPFLCGGILQLLSLYALARIGSYKRWIVTGVALQGLVFLPLIYAAIVGSMPAWAFFLIVSCYWGAGMASAPAWNAWISHVVPSRIRSKYFAKRTRVIQVAMLTGFLAGGWLLSLSKQWNQVLYGFAAIFVLASLARFASAYSLHRHQTSAEEDHAEPRTVSVWSAWGAVSPKARYLIAYLVCMQFCIQLSGPYFIPYMKKQLGYGNEVFVWVFASALVARIASMSLWGMLARRFGSQAVLFLGGLGLIPLSTLWIFSDSIVWLMFIQALAGLLWSAYELAFFLMFLDYIPQRRRADLLTIYYLASAAAFCLGSLVGGWWVATHGTTVAAYHGVFILSAFGRIGCVYLLWKTWTSSAYPRRPMDTSTTALGMGRSLVEESAEPRPDAGPSHRPIVDGRPEAA
jgi:MFS family permease